MSVADALRAGLESGDFGALGECYGDEAVLDLNVRGGRERVAGPAAIVARLERLFLGPGRLVEWTAALHDAGAAVWLERVPTPMLRSCDSATTCCCVTAA